MRTGDEKVVPLELSDETSAGLVVGVVVGSCDPTALGLLVPCADVLCILVFDQMGRRMALKGKSVQNRFKKLNIKYMGHFREKGPNAYILTS